MCKHPYYQVYRHNREPDKVVQFSLGSVLGSDHARERPEQLWHPTTLV